MRINDGIPSTASARTCFRQTEPTFRPWTALKGDSRTSSSCPHWPGSGTVSGASIPTLMAKPWTEKSDATIAFLKTTNHSLQLQGWTYAVDFPAEYSAKKTFTSCVRRRKWVRYRKYQAQDSWAAVPPLHKDITQVCLYLLDDASS